MYSARGSVFEIFIAEGAGAPMVSVPSVKAIAGAGLEGDRYAAKGTGFFSHIKPEKVRHVSIISLEAIREANAGLREPFKLSETRRNIVVSGIDLARCVDKEFFVGDVRMRYAEVCKPCSRPAVLAGKSDTSEFPRAYAGIRGGIRAEVLSDGIIKTGDPVWIVE